MSFTIKDVQTLKGPAVYITCDECGASSPHDNPILELRQQIEILQATNAELEKKVALFENHIVYGGRLE